MVGQDFGEKCLVGAKGGESIGRNGGEGLIGRREDRERAFALQGLDETGIGQELGERVEAAGGNGGVDDVLRCIGRRGGCGLGGSGLGFRGHGLGRGSGLRGDSLGLGGRSGCVFGVTAAGGQTEGYGKGGDGNSRTGSGHTHGGS